MFGGARQRACCKGRSARTAGLRLLRRLSRSDQTGNCQPIKYEGLQADRVASGFVAQFWWWQPFATGPPGRVSSSDLKLQNLYGDGVDDDYGDCAYSIDDEDHDDSDDCDER